MAELRDYQKVGINKIFKSWREGTRSVLFQMPTGTGKTFLFADITRRGFEQNRKILLVVHRIELVKQISEELEAKGIKVGYIVSGKESDYSKIVQVASVQTLSRRIHPESNLIIIDECHHAKANTYNKLWNIYPDAKFLGVTATPIRLGGQGFDDIFDELIISMQIQEFIDKGYLVAVTQYACITPDLSDIKINQGDYMISSLSNIMRDNSIMADIIESYKDKCNGKSTIVFAVDTDHSKEIVARFINEGISAAHVDSKTPKDQRERILNDFRNKQIQVVSNVEIITEGFNFPECEAIILARPTKSLALYLQMTGRVMRTAENKNEGIILDCAGLWKDHGLCTMNREWTLKGTKKKKKHDFDYSNNMVALDDDGFIDNKFNLFPSEIKGLKLVSLTDHYNHLRIFESFVSRALFSNHKIISAYYQFEDYLNFINTRMTFQEFKYIEKRLKVLNGNSSPEKAFKLSFLDIQESKLGFKNQIL